jgi:hypothetical protein
MKDGDTCTAKWKKVRDVIHPSQEALGFAAVKTKVKKDYKTEKKAQKRMNEPGSVLPFVLGPKGIPFLVDSHHTASALEVSGHQDVKVTLKKICDWSSLPEGDFYRKMLQHNFMVGVGRDGSDPNELPEKVDAVKSIPHKVAELKDDPWRSFGALVRKVTDEKCPSDNTKCLRGYIRECQHDGSMTAFFEFRWAYFMNDAYNRGCNNSESLWDDSSDCKKFERAYQNLLERDVGSPVLDQDIKAWQDAAKLLVPLCRGKKAHNYTLPDALGEPMGGEKLPGCVSGKDTHITKKDPDCAPPKCPTLPVFLSTCE